MLHSIFDILQVLYIGCDHVEVSLKALTSHTYRRYVSTQRLTVNDILLREDMYYLLPRGQLDVILLGNKAVHILLFYKGVVLRYHNAAVTGVRLDVLAGNTNPHFVNIHISLIGSFIDSLGNRLGRLRDTSHNTMLYAYRLRLAEAQNLHLAIFASHTNKAGYFCGTDVEAYNNFICHSICYFCLFLFFRANNLVPELKADLRICVPSSPRHALLIECHKVGELAA